MKFLSMIFVVILLIAGFTSGYVLSMFTYNVYKPTTITFLSEKTVTDTVTITITKTFHKTDGNNDTGCIIFKTNKEIYKISERVFLVLMNNCDYVLVLPNSAPWMIIDEGGEIVFSPIALQVITEVKPGNERKWTWNQRDNDGNQVSAGTYYVKLTTINGGILTTEFEISES